MINSRVNYPLKRILRLMEEYGQIDMNCDVTRFCVSFVTICVASVGMERFISAWNLHYISGTNKQDLSITHCTVFPPIVP